MNLNEMDRYTSDVSTQLRVTTQTTNPTKLIQKNIDRVSDGRVDVLTFCRFLDNNLALAEKTVLSSLVHACGEVNGEQIKAVTVLKSKGHEGWLGNLDLYKKCNNYLSTGTQKLSSYKMRPVEMENVRTAYKNTLKEKVSTNSEEALIEEFLIQHDNEI
jgi:hypothetical protein